MGRRQMATATAEITSPHEGNIFRTALRLIGQGFAEIVQGIRLIAEGTLRPVRSFVPSFVVLTSIGALTVATLVLVVTTVAQNDAQLFRDNGIWTRWSHSPEIHFGDNAVRASDLEYLGETDASSQEPLYVALWSADR